MNKTLWRNYAFNFFVNFAFFSAVLVPFYTQWGKISLFQVQILQSWFSFWILILDVPTGVLADHIGRKFTLALGAMIVAIAVLLYGSIPHFSIFLLGEFLFAIGISFISGADDALLYDQLKEENKENESKYYFGKANTFRLLGILTGAILGSFIAFRFGMNAPMLFSAIPFFIASLIGLTIKESQFKNSKKQNTLNTLKTAYSFFLNHRTLRLIALDSIVISAVAYFVIWFYQPLLQHIGIAIIYFGLFHALLVSTQMIISSNFGRLEKILGSAKSFIRFGALSTAASFLLVALFPNIWTIILLIVFAGGFGLSRWTLLSSYMNTYIPSLQRASILSSISMFRRLALVIFNPVIGFIATKSLGIAAFFLGLTALSVFLFSPIEEEMLK